VNISLQQLIENFVEKRDKIAQGVDPIGDDDEKGSNSWSKRILAPSSSLPHGSKSNPRALYHDARTFDGVDDERDMESEYAREYRTYSVRCEVLQNEQFDTEQELSELKKKMDGGEKVIAILLDEEKNALSRLRAAEMEVKLVRSRIQEQRVKLNGMEEKFENAKGCLEVVHEVYGNLKRERDKAKFILMELQGKEFSGESEMDD
jgi:chromosome segregation ATPase